MSVQLKELVTRFFPIHLWDPRELVGAHKKINIHFHFIWQHFATSAFNQIFPLITSQYEYKNFPFYFSVAFDNFSEAGGGGGGEGRSRNKKIKITFRANFDFLLQNTKEKKRRKMKSMCVFGIIFT